MRHQRQIWRQLGQRRYRLRIMMEAMSIENEARNGRKRMVLKKDCMEGRCREMVVDAWRDAGTCMERDNNGDKDREGHIDS